jgi:hypothetical protein
VTYALLDPIIESYEDKKWRLNLNYENIPFRCRNCHVHRHLFRYFLLNSKNKPRKKQGVDVDMFTNIQEKCKHTKRTNKPTGNEDAHNKNWFKYLEEKKIEDLGEDMKIKKHDTQKK